MKYVHSSVTVLGLVTASFWAAGCGGQSTKRIPVSGTVRVGGAVLDNAGITFLPLTSTAGPSASTGVLKGYYQFSVTDGPWPGKYRVIVRMAPPGKDDPPLPVGAAGLKSWENEVEVPSLVPCVIDLELD